MVKLVDTPDLKSVSEIGVWVRVPLALPKWIGNSAVE